jgi:hypothetical protein
MRLLKECVLGTGIACQVASHTKGLVLSMAADVWMPQMAVCASRIPATVLRRLVFTRPLLVLPGLMVRSVIAVSRSRDRTIISVAPTAQRR